MFMMENYLCGFEKELLDFCYESVGSYDTGFEEDFLDDSPFGSNGEENDCSDLENSLQTHASLDDGYSAFIDRTIDLGTGVGGGVDGGDEEDEDEEEISGNRKAGFGPLRGKPVRKALQRRAANMRERRRMKSINDAFDKLRTCIPDTVTTERRLSKVDTLRLAIRYIEYLSDMVQSCNEYGVDKRMTKSPRHQEKVIMWCHLTTQTGDLFSDCWPETELVGHSLSWENESAPKVSHDKKHTARTWHPETPNTSDFINLASYGS